MSNKIQTKKNIGLTQKFNGFLKGPPRLPKLPRDVSFVPFSKEDKKLNEANEELLETLSKEDKPVARAEEPKSSNGNWIITPVNF